MDIKELAEYLERTLACRVGLSACATDGLAYFVCRFFLPYRAVLFDQELIFLIAQPSFVDFSIKDITSAVFMTEEHYSLPVVLVLADMTRRERLLLIKRRISFIVVGTQLFVPYLGIDFFDRIKEQRRIEGSRLRPAAQAILLENLLSYRAGGWLLAELARHMRYSSMGTHRAVGQLEELSLCRLSSDGYRKTVHFDADRRALWERALAYMRSPVKKIIALEDDDIFRRCDYLYAGEYALAMHSSLSVSRKCYAIHEKKYAELRQQGLIREAAGAVEGAADLQIWRYSLPDGAQKGKNTVDLLSLELSCKDSSEARVQIALLKLQEERKW